MTVYSTYEYFLNFLYYTAEFLNEYINSFKSITIQIEADTGQLHL